MGSYIYAGEFAWFFDQGDIKGPLLDLLYTWDDAFGVWVAVSLMFTRRDAFGVRSELRSCVYSGLPLTPKASLRVNIRGTDTRTPKASSHVYNKSSRGPSISPWSKNQANSQARCSFPAPYYQPINHFVQRRKPHSTWTNKLHFFMSKTITEAENSQKSKQNFLLAVWFWA